MKSLNFTIPIPKYCCGFCIIIIGFEFPWIYNEIVNWRRRQMPITVERERGGLKETRKSDSEQVNLRLRK